MSFVVCINTDDAGHASRKIWRALLAIIYVLKTNLKGESGLASSNFSMLFTRISASLQNFFNFFNDVAGVKLLSSKQ